MYYFFEPPYFLLIAGLLAGILSGVAFETTLKLFVKDWSQNRNSKTLSNLKGTQLFVPFLGISAGVAIFLGSGLTIFGIPLKLAYGVSIILTILIGWLIWSQLKKVLIQLERGGSEALDLDSIR